MATELAVTETAIPGLLFIDLPVHGDNRGWFKENWQRAKMTALGLPDFGPVQNNVSFNAEVGVTRGVHAEPWDKLVSVTAGKIFGAWVDLREGQTFGTVVTCEMGPERAVFVPNGVGNSFQTLQPGTAYSYLVNDHWSADKRDQYTFVNLADPSLAIAWPIALDGSSGTSVELSEADRTHPMLEQVVPMRPSAAAAGHSPTAGVVVLGSNGQLGTALRETLIGATFLTRAEVDLADPASIAALDLTGVDTVINAAAHTAVDAAETADGRRDAWAVNVTGVAALVERCRQAGVRLVHVSSDYVFDGTVEEHTEDEPLSPLGVYGQTKAAGDAIVATLPRHLIVRTSWVIGAGKNFVATMASLADRGISPAVVADQFGRLTFTADLAAGIAHLVQGSSPSGIYNLSNSGPVQSWHQIAQDVFAARGRDRDDVSATTAANYAAQQLAAGTVLAPRPQHSALSLAKLTAAGFTPRSAEYALSEYLAD